MVVDEISHTVFPSEAAALTVSSESPSGTMSLACCAAFGAPGGSMERSLRAHTALASHSRVCARRSRFYRLPGENFRRASNEFGGAAHPSLPRRSGKKGGCRTSVWGSLTEP